MNSEHKFEPGQTVSTPGALEELTRAGVRPIEIYERHLRLEQGSLCDEDHEENKKAIENENRIFSAFKLSTGAEIYVITEWDRSVTTILKPSEY